MNIVQRLLVACDDHITASNLRTNMQKDKACADYLSGALAVMSFAPHPFNGQTHQQIAERLYYINLGGYARIHNMAITARAESAPVPAVRNVGGE